MYYFDRVEEKEINGKFDVFAINDQNGQAYLLRNAIVSYSSSTLNEFSLSIGCYPESYAYRGTFKTEAEMNRFAHSVQALLHGADKKNHAILRG